MHYILVVMLLGANIGNTTYQEFNNKKACDTAQKDIIKQYTNLEQHGGVQSVIFLCEPKGK